MTVHYYDQAKKQYRPLNILVIGPSGSGKTTFAGILHQKKSWLTAADADVYQDQVICIGENNSIDVSKFSHVLYVDAGARLPIDDNAPTFDPHTMILVDNAQGLDRLEEEADYVLESLGTLRLTKGSDDIKPETEEEKVALVLGRIETELNELKERANKLGAFMSTEKYQHIGAVQQSLLMQQFNYMQSYANVLSARYTNLTFMVYLQEKNADSKKIH